MGDFVAGEIPLLSSFLYLLGEAERVRCSLTSDSCHGVLEPSAQSGVPVPAPASSGVPFARFVRSASGLPGSGRRFTLLRDPIRGHCQAGSLTGAVHLSKNNAGVLRPAQRGQKPRVEQKGKSWLDPDVQYA